MSSTATQKTIRKDYSERDLQHLFSFYLECVEEEDLRSLTLRISQLHRSFLSPWEDREPFFHPNATEVRFKTTYKSDRNLLLRGVLQAGEPQRFFYGYPIFLDSRDNISPLFFSEVEVRQVGDNDFLLRPIDSEEIQLNHHFFRYQRLEIEELQEIQDYLEGSFGSFSARLKAAFDYLGLYPQNWEDDKIDKFPGKNALRDTWYNRPILFRSERSIFTVHLRRELEALRKYPRFLDEAMDTAIGYLLSPRKIREKDVNNSNLRLIEVRPLNISQERALQSGLTAPLTVVTGPPGTGKSQVIVNLLANCVINGKTVLFASKNNKAVDVVKDWLAKILGQEQDWVFRAGSRERMEKLQEEMSKRLEKLVKPEKNEKISAFDNRINKYNREIDLLRERIIENQKLLKRLTEVDKKRRRAQDIVQDKWVAGTPENYKFNGDFFEIDRLKRETDALISGKGMGLKLWLLRLLLGQRLLEKYLVNLKMLIDSLPIAPIINEELEQMMEKGATYQDINFKVKEISNYLYWVRCRNEAKDLLNEVRNQEDANSLLFKMDNLKNEKAIMSREILRDFWTEKIASNKERVHHLIRRYFNLSDKIWKVKDHEGWLYVRNDFENTCRELFNFFPIWVVTSLSARRSLPLTAGMFDICVIDEASQCDIASALPVLFRAQNAVIIGDPRQLRHISTLTDKQELRIAEETKATSLLADWSYISNSLYDAAEASIIRAGDSPIFLNEHYRCHPKIIDFSNRIFYSSSLILRTKIQELGERIGEIDLGLFWHDIKGSVPDTLHSAYNEEEANRIIAIIEQWAKSGLIGDANLIIGIVTPFRRQMELIEEIIQKNTWLNTFKDNITVGTAHKFQGDEADIVFFSPVVSQGIHPRKAQWVAKTDQLLNVALTRARGALHVVGDYQTCLKSGGSLAKFAEHVSEILGDINQSNKSFESPAEEKFAELLNKVGLWYQTQYKEGRYRLDFFVVSPFGTRYNLEVDGRQHLSPEQLANDEIRDKNLEDLGYKVIRFEAKTIFERPQDVKDVLYRLT